MRIPPRRFHLVRVLVCLAVLMAACSSSATMAEPESAHDTDRSPSSATTDAAEIAAPQPAPSPSAEAGPRGAAEATAIPVVVTPNELTPETILDATLAVDRIDFTSELDVEGWTSIGGEGSIFPAEDRATVATYLQELDRRTVDLLQLEFVDGEARIAPLDDPDDVRLGEEGLPEVLFTIDSLAEGTDLRSFFHDMLTQVDIAPADDQQGLEGSTLTRLLDTDPDDDVGVEIVVDAQSRLHRIELYRPTLDGDDRFAQSADFRYPAPTTTLPVGDLPPRRDPAIPRVVDPEAGLCANLDTVYTTRLDGRHDIALGIGPEDDWATFFPAATDYFNEYDNQQLMRDEGITDAYDGFVLLESRLHNHAYGGVPAHEVDLGPNEDAADRFGAWVTRLCPTIDSAIVHLPDAAELIVAPTDAEIDAGRATFCLALLRVFEARDAFRATAEATPGPFTPTARAAYGDFLSAIDDAVRAHDSVGFVTDDPELLMRWRLAAFEQTEVQVRQALFTPIVPVNERSLHLRGEHMDRIGAYARAECGFTVEPWLPDLATYDRAAVDSTFGDDPQEAFCHAAEQELRLRRAYRSQLEVLERGDADGVVNAHVLLHRLVSVARASRNELWAANEYQGDYSSPWWAISTVEWTLGAALPASDAVPSVDDHGFPFEPAHDPAPTESASQREVIAALLAERDEGLAVARDLCAFDEALLASDGDLELLERLWTLRD